VSADAAAAMARAASSYLAIEIDPETNSRGGRMSEISRLMSARTGAEATLVVNNNAAAVLLTLAAIAARREVVVSRGEAVEIGGGFRIPDVIAQSGCLLVEVGTTNRTYVADYGRAVGPETAALLKVHASNFQVEGFTAKAATSELGTLARERSLPLIEDLGSGALLDTAQFGLRHEPTVAEAIADGATVVTLSGDKLLGGPQAGIIAGRRDVIQQIERHPLARAVRADKVTIAGVTATLRHYLAGNAHTEIPIWRMIGATRDELSSRATQIARQTALTVVDSTASIGGGSLPGETMASIALKIETPHPDQVARALRTGTPGVFPIIREGAVLVDLRTVQPEQDQRLLQALRAALGRSA
jgi:L-seryl-tRNA(Ser) seleniumtransferase